jgi:outer membrane protein TolC
MSALLQFAFCLSFALTLLGWFPTRGQGAEPSGAAGQGKEKVLTLKEKEKALTLEDAVSYGLENNPSIKAAREKVGAQQAVLGQQLGAYYPTININNTYRTSTASGTTGVSPSAFDFVQSQTTFNMTLYNFGKREGAVQSARDTLDATRYNLKTAADAVVLSVKQAYYAYLAAKALVKVGEETVKDRQLIVRQAQAFYEVGTKPKIDVVRAEANLYSAQSGLIAAQNGMKVAWVMLKNAMGLPDLPEQPLAPVTPAMVEGFSAIRFPLSLEQARAQAFDIRPEMKSFEAQRRAQDQTIATNRRGHLPDLIFDANYARRQTSNATNAAGHQIPTFPLQPTWQVQLSLNIPIFDGFRTTNKVEESVRTYYSIKAQEEQQRQLVALEVEQSYVNLVNAQERIKATKAAEQAAKENLDLANGRYQVGVGSIIEVTDAQATYTSAEVDYVRALYDYKIAEAQLNKAVGTP